MTEKLQQIIKEEVAKLPQENREAIGSSNWIKISEEIGAKYLLTESELNDFQVEILLVLIGLEESDFFSSNVENNVGTSKKSAEKISEDTFQEIFIPISQIIIKKIQNSEKIKNAKFDQNLGFILSGGDYSHFTDSKKMGASENLPNKDKLQENLQKTLEAKRKFVI